MVRKLRQRTQLSCRMPIMPIYHVIANHWLATMPTKFDWQHANHANHWLATTIAVVANHGFVVANHGFVVANHGFVVGNHEIVIGNHGNRGCQQSRCGWQPRLSWLATISLWLAITDIGVGNNLAQVNFA